MSDAFYKSSFLLNYLMLLCDREPTAVVVCALFRCSRLISIAFLWQKKLCVQCVQTKQQKVRNITSKILITLSCFKIQEN